jgi:LacI family transcriptional regulator
MSAPLDQRPTLRSLAAITGLGVSTVSQALRDSPEIALETRKRVQLAAQQAGYRPNRAGVRLRTGKSNVITLVLNANDDSSGFFAKVVYGITDALAGTAFHLVVTPYSLSDPMAPIRYIVETNSADGVIISRIQRDDPRVRYLAENNMPFVTHGRTDCDIMHAYYDHDNEAFAFEAVKALAARGRKHIALAGPPPNLNYFRHAQMGFEHGLQHCGISGFALANANSDSAIDDLRQAGLEMATRRERPDGIICVTSGTAPGIVTGLAQGGLRIGHDYDVVAKPVSDFTSMMIPELICMNEDFRAAGHHLAEMLMALIGGTDARSLQMLEQPPTAV